VKVPAEYWIKAGKAYPLVLTGVFMIVPGHKIGNTSGDIVRLLMTVLLARAVAKHGGIDCKSLIGY
jgi:hypothetical protein